jgi:hypothetical protein
VCKPLPTIYLKTNLYKHSKYRFILLAPHSIARTAALHRANYHRSSRAARETARAANPARSPARSHASKSANQQTNNPLSNQPEHQSIRAQEKQLTSPINLRAPQTCLRTHSQTISITRAIQFTLHLIGDIVFSQADNKNR